MGLDIEDMKYMNTQFGLVHSRINDVQRDLDMKASETRSRLTEIETTMNIHIAQTKSRKISDTQKILAIIGVAGSFVLFGISQVIA